MIVLIFKNFYSFVILVNYSMRGNITVAPIGAVDHTVALPFIGDTTALVGARHMSLRTRGRAVGLIGLVATIVFPIAAELQVDAMVIASKLRGTTGDTAILLVRSISTVIWRD